MRKWLVIPVLIGLLWAWPWAGAMADDNVTVTASVSPQTLSAAGNVTLTVRVENSANAPYTMENVRVLRGGAALIEMGDIYPADNRTRQAALSVSEEELGRAIGLVLAWSEGGEEKTRDFSVTVSGEDAQPEVEFSRSLPEQVARVGDDVLVTYYVRNVGAVDITHLTITDSQAGVSESLDRLAVGSDVWKKVISHKMTGAFASNPTLRYTCGDRVYTTTLDAISVEPARTEMTAVLEADQTHVAAGGTVSLICTVTNTGNVDLSTVTVNHEGMGQIAVATNLEAGASRVFEHSITPPETGDYFFTVTGRDSAGTEAEAQTNSVTVNVETEPSPICMTLSVSYDRQELARPGDVVFQLTAENMGEQALSGVQLLDQDGLILTTFDSLPAGQRQTYVHTVRVTDDKVYLFKLSLLDEEGEVREVTSEPVAVEVAAPDPTPEPTGSTVVSDVTQGPETTGQTASPSDARPMSTELRAILVAIGLIAVAIAVLIVLIFRDRERSRANRYKRRR